MLERPYGCGCALGRGLQRTSRLPDTEAALRSYRALASRYGEACVGIAAVREYALSRLDTRPGEVVADVACGSGAMLPALAARVGTRGRVIGIEQSDEMLALARGRFADR